MSRSIRLLYIILPSVSLLLAWFSVQQIRDTSHSWSGSLHFGISMLILSWIVMKATQRATAIDANVYLFTSPYLYLNHGTIYFVADDPDGMDIVNPLTSSAAIPDPPPGLQPLFVFVPERLSELEVIKRRYPGGQLDEYRIQPGGDRTIMYIYEPLLYQ